MLREIPRTSLAVALACALLGASLTARTYQEQTADQKPARADGWTIPPEAAQETNPVPDTPQTQAAGRALFQKNCQRCHGPKGIGDGPDADPDNMADMDLTNPKRTSRNPDGVVFYKAWNGRTKPKMPAFKEKLTKEQVWTIVRYVQTLRKSASE
jgi:mono/diheme cytochrome c family protein